MDKPRRKLSKSACEKYMQCPASFDYHYNQKIRPIKTSSPLVFGGGVDVGLNCILLNEGDSLEAYRASVSTTPLGTMLPHHNDYDGDLLSDEQRTALLVSLKDVGYNGDDIDGLASNLLNRIRVGEELTDNQYKAIDLIVRAVLEEKARLMFAAYQRDIMPHIKKVIGVQEYAGPGVLDAIVEWDGVGTIILDNKTATKFYADNAVEYSHQLAMYAGEKKIYKVAFVVLGKTIDKNKVRVCELCEDVSSNPRVKTCDQMVDGTRCGGNFEVTILPDVRTQVIHGEVTPEMIAVSDELQREVQRAVDAKIFPCNVNQCNSQFGKSCIYRDLKWKGDMRGLEVKDKK